MSCNSYSPRLDGWDHAAHPMKKDDFGSFDIVIPAKDGQPAIPHNSKLKVTFF